MTDRTDDFEAEGREISRLACRWPAVIGEAVKATAAAEKVLTDLLELYDVELAEAADGDDAKADFAEIKRRLRNIGRIADIRARIERDWHASVRQQQQEAEAARDAASGAEVAGPEVVRDLEELADEILGTFSNRGGDGYRARVGQVQMAKWRARRTRNNEETKETDA